MNTLTYRVHTDIANEKPYEANGLEDLAKFLAEKQPSKFFLVVLVNGTSETGHGTYERATNKSVYRASKSQYLHMSLADEYGEAKGLSALINEELAKQLAA